MPTPPRPQQHTHTHTLRAETHSSPGAGPPCAPVLVYLREAGEAGWEHTLRWILCSACQCGSFDPQPADDRSTLSSQSSRARAASAQAERCCKSTSISGNQLSAGGQNPACRNMSCGCKPKKWRITGLTAPHCWNRNPPFLILAND